MLWYQYGTQLGRRVASSFIGATIALFMTASAGYAAADASDYRISPGDELELLVVRLPQLSATAQVTASGEISFPLVGVIDAAGREIDEVRQAVRSILSNKVLDGFDPMQPNAMVLLDPEEVDVRISAYRPIFIDGDVENRGALGYRPGMTIRQAIVEAGGYAVNRYLLEDNGVTEAALSANYQGLWIDYASDIWRIWSLRSELGMDPGPKPESAEFPVGKESLALIGESEVARLLERESAFKTVIENLESRRATAEARLDLLEQQLASEQSAVEYDKTELARAEGLLKRGNGTRTRVADIRRTLLISQSRFLEVQSQLAEYERDASMAAQAVVEARTERRVNLLDELSLMQGQRAKRREQIESMAVRLKQKTAARSVRPLGSTSTGVKMQGVSFTIYRAATDEVIDNASPNEVVAPGDVVEVALEPLKL